MTEPRPICEVIDLGMMSYEQAFARQKAEVDRLQQSPSDIERLFLLEHPHVVTKGRNASLEAIIADEALMATRGVELVETDRGGDVTYHGPGQLVGYPVIALEHPRRDIRRYVHDLEEALIRTLSWFGIKGGRNDEHRGVWLGSRKIASVGVRVSRWVTSHGFALNVATDLSYFSLIHPCGIVDCEMTTMNKELDTELDMNHVKKIFAVEFAGVFDRQLTTNGAGGAIELR